MRCWNRFFSIPVATCYLAVCIRGVFASPPVNVALEASFPSPPWIVELLEAAAFENSTLYIPLLDNIAAGHFDAEIKSANDEKLFASFLQTLKTHGHLDDPFSIASLKLSLSLREAAPRIQAHYQYWDTSVKKSFDNVPVFSAWQPGKIHCLDAQCTSSKVITAIPGTDDHTSRSLKFDNVHYGSKLNPFWTLYLDPSSAESMRLYSQWRSINPDASFRIRYCSPKYVKTPKPLAVSGYGVELALKKTDYIVIDDREAESTKEPAAADAAVDLDSKELDDVKPVSYSELQDLGFKTASYIMASENPFETLVRVTQDFPKHASNLAQYNASVDFWKEHQGNRERFLGAGFNAVWINGLHVSPRDIDPYLLLNNVRRERQLIRSLQDLGFSPSEAVNLLTEPSVAGMSGNGDAQRYDWRDDSDGGNVIIWLNNLEKDKRYAAWPAEIRAFLQRVFPGQLPSVRKDLHNAIFPLDLTSETDVVFIVQMLQTFIQRQIAIRFGIVPIVSSAGAQEQAKVVNYLQEAYGLAAVILYLETSLQEGKLASPDQSAFETAIAERKLRRDQSQLSLQDVLASEKYKSRLDNIKHYLTRLGATGATPPIFANGVPIPNDNDFLQMMSQRLSLDLQTIQDQIYDEQVSQKTWLPGLFLSTASLQRNPLIIPEDESDVKLFDMGKLFAEHADEFKILDPPNGGNLEHTRVTVFMDMNSISGIDMLLNAIEFAFSREDTVDVAIKHSSTTGSESGLTESGHEKILEVFGATRKHMSDEERWKVNLVLKNLLLEEQESTQSGQSALVKALGLNQGDNAVLVNGRLIGPLSVETPFTIGDFNTLVDYELKKRIIPTQEALKNLNLTSRITNQKELAKLTSLVALSSVSDDPEGLFDMKSGPRMNTFKYLNSTYTCIKHGNTENAPIEIIASLDPMTETAQRWTPILHAFSKLDGVTTEIYLNPKQKIKELPVKRFYRQVLDSEPKFVDGSLKTPSAQFLGIPQDTLLTAGMDTPPSWLVAPKISEDDLDNIKLNSIKRPSEGVNAIYELEHILIEGHSRDMTSAEQPPRGVQLVLETESNADYGDTIVMANLGYFQFKANPGIYNLTLKTGRSREIFHLDSAGNLGYSKQGGDENTEIALTSFQGSTVFPRLSRNAGKEKEDVLETEETVSQTFKDATQKAMDSASAKAKALIAKGTEIADDLLAKAGIPNANTGEYIDKGLDFGQSVLSNFNLSPKNEADNVQGQTPIIVQKQADINIFSVASGHLYERMLNIMMVSVMRHTNHSVKFWFIEQFLSPSFKTFLPTMAAEYGFEYEMVTFKWPHWLRAQKEKQRIIWGYKILFLDVLFPLDLDKVIFVDADQIVRTDMYELVTHDLEGAPYGFTPMCDSRTEMEGFRFWKQGYWKNFLHGLPYHISALYVVDLKQFRTLAAGDRLRQQYQSLSADPASLSNLDQDLPNHMQGMLPIHSLPQDWLWCETWCDDESLKTAKTIDLCNNPQTKEPKLDRARRQVPEWTLYDEEIAALARRTKGSHETSPAVQEQEATSTRSRSSSSQETKSVKDEL